jgi:hypothetical protein
MHSLSTASSNASSWHHDLQQEQSTPNRHQRSSAASSVSHASDAPDVQGRGTGAASATLSERLLFLGARALRQLPVAVSAGLAGWAVQAGGLKIALNAGAHGKDALPWIQFAGHVIEAFIKEGGGETIEFAIGPRLSVPAGTGTSKWFPHSLQSGLARFGASMSEAGSTIADAMIRAFAYDRMRTRFGNEIAGGGDKSDVTMRILGDLGNKELLAVKGVSSGLWLVHKAWEGVAVVAMPGARRDNRALSEIWKDLAVREAIGVAVRTAAGAGNSAWLSHLAHQGETGYLFGAYSGSVPAALQAARPFAIDVLFYLYLVHVKPRLETRTPDLEAATETHLLPQMTVSEDGREGRGAIAADHDTAHGATPSQAMPRVMAESPASDDVAETGSATARSNEGAVNSIGNKSEPERTQPHSSARQQMLDEAPTVPAADAASSGKSMMARSSVGSSIAENGAPRPGEPGKGKQKEN